MVQLNEKTQQKQRRKFRFFFLSILGLLLIGVLASAFVWLSRKNIALSAMQNWCIEQSIACSGEFTQIGLDQISLENLEVRSQNEIPFASEKIVLVLTWPAFLKPELVRVSVTKPTVRAAIVDGALGLSGLEGVITEQMDADGESTGSGSVPELDIQNGLLVLQTDAGEVSGTFELQGKPLEYGTASLNIAPNRLQKGDAEIAWSEGDIELSFQDGAILGDVDVSIETARLDGLSVSNGMVRARLADQGVQIAFELDGRASEFSAPGIAAESVGVRAQGGVLRIDALNRAALLDAVGKVTFGLVGGSVILESQSGPVQMTAISVNLDVDKTRTGLTGPIGVDIKGLELTQGKIGSVTASGDIAIAAEETLAYRYKGGLVVENVGIARPTRVRLLAGIALPTPLDLHGLQLQNGLSAALRGFDVGFDLDTSYRETGWTLAAKRATLLKAVSGLTLSIDPPPNQPWLKASDEGIMLAGDISMLGGEGMPKVTTALSEFLLMGDDTSLYVRDLKLVPWRVGGRVLSAEIDTLDLGAGERMRVATSGEITLWGALPGLDLKPTGFIGNISAVQGSEGWRVQTHNNSCVGFTSEGMSSGALIFAPTVLSLCPVDGRFIRQERGESLGRIRLGDIDMPFATGEATGRFAVKDATLEWLADDALKLSIRGKSFQLPLEIGGETLVIEGANPEVGFGVGGGPVHISAILGRTEFGGTMVPANVTADAFSFEGASSQTGIDGQMRAGKVRISDLSADPVYQPLIAQLQATLQNGIISMRGPLRNESKGVVIANTNLNVHLAEFNGDATIIMVPLSFAVGGLQPVDLSELLRGVLINAQGSMTGRADFKINNGALSGSGHVGLDDLILDTFSAGRVSGVNGHIEFSDILELTTPPGQEIKIGSMSPGVPLSDGVINFQIIKGTTTKLEGAKWPFTGGELIVLPTVFKAGGAVAKSDTITVEARGWQLDQLIEVLRVPDLRATGTVSGRFPINLEGANIMIRNASLIADEEGGSLAYTGGATDAVKGQNEYADYAFEALRNFDYKVMEIGADGNLIGRLVITANILGSNQQVLGGSEFDFTVSVDSELSRLLQSVSDASSQTYISEALELSGQKKRENAN